MQWSQQAIAAIQPIYTQIMIHPFIQQLADGSLNAAQFRHYIEQDALYLAQYRKIMAAIAARCDDLVHQNCFLHFAVATIEAEQALHQTFLGQQDLTQLSASPSNLLYTGYLYQQLNTQPLAVCIASILPCFYLYQQVGQALQTQSIDDAHPYAQWINTYASATFEQDVKTVLTIADELAKASTEAICAQMTEVFIQASKMEWLFWDSAWREETWLI